MKRSLCMCLAVLLFLGAVLPMATAVEAEFTTEPMIAAGQFSTVALRGDGTVWMWGLGAELTPTQVQGLSSIRAIAVGGGHTVVLRSDGTVWAWGSNRFGQLGDGTRGHWSEEGEWISTDRGTPVQVLGPYGEGYLTNVTAIAAGSHHTVALRSDGTVWACVQFI